MSWVVFGTLAVHCFHTHARMHVKARTHIKDNTHTHTHTHTHTPLSRPIAVLQTAGRRGVGLSDKQGRSGG